MIDQIVLYIAEATYLAIDSLYFLLGRLSMHFYSFSGLDRLAIDDRYRESFFFSSGLSDHLSENVVDLRPDSFQCPLPKHPVNRRPLGEFLGEIPPLVTGPTPVKDCIRNRLSIDGFPPKSPRCGKYFPDNLPLILGKVAGIIRFVLHRFGALRGCLVDPTGSHNDFYRSKRFQNTF